MMRKKRPNLAEILFWSILSAGALFWGCLNLEAAGSSQSGMAKLRAPARTVRKEEVELFRGLTQGISKVGLVTPQEKKVLGQTIEKEKRGILRRTVEQIYENAYDLYRKGRYQEALELLNRIAALDPTYDRAIRLKSALSSARAASASGKNISQPAPRSARGLIEDKFYEAIGIYKEGRRVAAIEKFEEVLALDPRHRKAQSYIKRLNSELAGEYFQKGKVAYTQGRLEDALEAFYSAVSLDAETYSFLQRQITELETDVRGLKIEKLLSQALGHLNALDWPEARASAKMIFSLDPTNARAQEIIEEAYEREEAEYFQKADAFLAKKQFEEAIGIYEKVVKLGHQTAKAKEKIEHARQRMKETAEEERRRREEEAARKEMEERVKAASGSSGPSDAASAESSRMDKQRTSEEARQAAEGHYQQAMKFYQTGDMSRALTELNLALKYDPNNQSAYAAKRRIEADMAK